MIPGPPPVMIEKPARPSTAAVSRAFAYIGSSRGVRAEPKIETALPTCASRSKPEPQLLLDPPQRARRRRAGRRSPASRPRAAPRRPRSAPADACAGTPPRRRPGSSGGAGEDLVVAATDPCRPRVVGPDSWTMARRPARASRPRARRPAGLLLGTLPGAVPAAGARSPSLDLLQVDDEDERLVRRRSPAAGPAGRRPARAGSRAGGGRPPSSPRCPGPSPGSPDRRRAGTRTAAPRSHEASNWLPVDQELPTYCIETVSPAFAALPLPSTMSSVTSSAGGEPVGLLDAGFSERSLEIAAGRSRRRASGVASAVGSRRGARFLLVVVAARAAKRARNRQASRIGRRVMRGSG